MKELLEPNIILTSFGPALQFAEPRLLPEAWCSAVTVGKRQSWQRRLEEEYSPDSNMNLTI